MLQTNRPSNHSVGISNNCIPVLADLAFKEEVCHSISPNSLEIHMAADCQALDLIHTLNECDIYISDQVVQ